LSCLSSGGPDARIRAHPRAAFRELEAGEGGVLLQLDSGGYHGLNTMGCLIWTLINEEGPTFDELVTAARDRVSDPPEQLAEDVRTFVETLCDRDLIVVSPGS
jgi:hypothetical protein